MVSTRERSLTHYEVLGLSPTCAPEIIEATYQSLIGKYGDNDGDKERIRKIEAAYHALNDPQRRRAYDATIGKSAPAGAAVKTWIFGLRPASSEAAPSSPAERVAPLETVTETAGGAESPTMAQPDAPPAERMALPETVIGRKRGATAPIIAQPDAPPVEQSPSHDPAVSGGRPDEDPSAKHILVPPEPSVARPSASLSELLLPADESTEEPMPRGEFGWYRVGLPLVGVLAVIAAAWSAQFLIGGSPSGNGTDVPRAAPAAVDASPTMRSPGKVTLQPTDRGADQKARFEVAEQLPLSATAADGLPDAGTEGQQNAAALAPSGTAQIDVAPQAGSASADDSIATQSASPAPATSGPEAPTAAPPVVTENQQGVASVAGEQSKAAPARWISGGLQDSDNAGGRFEGLVGVRIIVRPDGRAGGCRVTQSSGNSSLDDVTCQLVRERLQFSPARDAAGQPIESEVSTTYTWGRRVRKK